MGDESGASSIESPGEELRRLNRAYRALCLCQGHVIRATTERGLLEALCQTLVDVGGYRMAWVGMTDLETRRVHPVAIAGSAADQAYLDEVTIGWADDELGRGPTGTALRTGIPAINRDSEANPAYGPWREPALRRGFRSSIAVPFSIGGKLSGALMVYSGEPNAFDREECSLLVRFAEDIAFGIFTLRARQTLGELQTQLLEADRVRTRFAILDEAPNAFVAIGRDWRCLYVNAAGAEQVGMAAESLVGRVIWETFPGTVDTPLWAALHRAMDTRETVELEDYHTPGERWFEVRAYPIASGIAVYFADVTARHRLVLALRESEERFRQLAESVDDVFWLSSVDKKKLFYVSPAYETIWGRSPAPLLTDVGNWLATVHPDDRLRLEQALPRQAFGEWSETYRIVRPDGTVRSVKSRAYPVRDAEGNVYRLAGVTRDISEQLRLEERLRQGEKMEAVGRLAGGLAHDFNNILSVITSYTSLLLEDSSLPAPVHADIEEVRRAGNRAAELTQQLLAFSRQQMLSPKVLDLGEIVLGMGNMLRRLLGEDIELSIDVSPHAGKVHADPSQIEQIVMNLSANARDAMPRGGELFIQVADVELDASSSAREEGVAPGSYVMLAIRDTGVGMDASTRERIFEPFYTTKEVGKGTGLGLSTVFGIVKQSKGHIWVESEKGAGTAFKALFPRTGVRAATNDSRRASPESLGGSETILVVEDDAQVRHATAAILRRHGYRVLEAATGDGALRVCETHDAEIDLLLTDVVMPNMSGRELVKRVAATRPHLRVLYLSGYTEDAVLLHGVLADGIAFLQKPVAPDVLLGKVRALLDGTDAE